MATGWNNQLIKQVGVYLVACELALRGLLVTTFSGNVPGFDLIVTDSTISVCFRRYFEEMQRGSILCA